MKLNKIFNLFRAFFSSNSPLVVLILMIILSSLIFPNFLTRLNICAIVKQYSIIGFLALGQLLVLITGGIDLSQGSMVAFTSIVVAVLMEPCGIFISVTVAIISSTFLGFINGFLVSRTKIPPFVVTLGMLSIVRGLALTISNTKPISINNDIFIQFGKETVFNVPLIFIVWIIASIILHLYINRRKMGCYIYATGGSEESARLSGVNVRRVKLFVYTLCAFLAAIGGVIWAARLRSGSPIGGSGYELESIAAVLVGGGSLFGGVGSILGTLAGVLTFGVINSSLNMAGISPYWQGTLKGIIIIIAVVISQIRLLRRDRN